MLEVKEDRLGRVVACSRPLFGSRCQILTRVVVHRAACPGRPAGDSLQQASGDRLDANRVRRAPAEELRAAGQAGTGLLVLVPRAVICLLPWSSRDFDSLVSVVTSGVHRASVIALLTTGVPGSCRVLFFGAHTPFLQPLPAGSMVEALSQPVSQLPSDTYHRAVSSLGLMDRSGLLP